MSSIKKIVFSLLLILTSIACRANYRDWQAPGCTIEKPELTILQISDTHLRDSTDGQWLAAQLKTATEKYRPDIIVHTGDITLDGELVEWQAFEEAIRNVKPVPELVWGNHDMPLKKTSLKKKGATRFVDYGEYRLVFIDTAWEGTLKGSYTSIPDTEFPELQKAAQTTKFILLFAHHPLGKEAPHFRLNNADAVLNLFAGKKLIGAFTGHFHGAYLAPEGNVLFAGVAPLTRQRMNHTASQSKGYRLIEIQNGCLRSKHITLD